LSIRTRLALWYTGLLLVILVVIGGLGYRALAWSLTQDVDASLVTVAQVISDLHRASPELPGEAALGEIVGPEFYDKLFQFLDPRGRPANRSTSLRHRSLPLSATAQENAARGQHTFETVSLDGHGRVRLLTMPIEQAGQPAQLIQVGIPLKRVEGTLRRYLQIVAALVPLGVGLAAVGGAVIARAALAPVDEMARSARRITAEALGQRIARRGANDELDYLAETLNGMLGRLEEAFGAMRRFTADAAHELRTPLTALKGGIEVALRASRSAAEYRGVLRGSLEEVNRLIHLAEDLLLLSRSSTGAGIRRERVELEPLLLEILEIGARLAREAGVVMSLSRITPAQVIGDESALRRALLNLVENALKYTPAGGRVELSLAQEAGSVLIVVEDTGIGIDPADAERIFQPFVRLDEARSRETGGSGLGLSIARSIVLAHGGALSLESAPKIGSRFTMRLPSA
jgi:heavy metal sensor kinase